MTYETQNIKIHSTAEMSMEGQLCEGLNHSYEIYFVTYVENKLGHQFIFSVRDIFDNESSDKNVSIFKLIQMGKNINMTILSIQTDSKLGHFDILTSAGFVIILYYNNMISKSVNTNKLFRIIYFTLIMTRHETFKSRKLQEKGSFID